MMTVHASQLYRHAHGHEVKSQRVKLGPQLIRSGLYVRPLQKINGTRQVAQSADGSVHSCPVRNLRLYILFENEN